MTKAQRQNGQKSSNSNTTEKGASENWIARRVRELQATSRRKQMESEESSKSIILNW